MTPCSLCNGSLEIIGTLGPVSYARCRNCGMVSAVDDMEEQIGYSDPRDEGAFPEEDEDDDEYYG